MGTAIEAKYSLIKIFIKNDTSNRKALVLITTFIFLSFLNFWFDCLDLIRLLLGQDAD